MLLFAFMYISCSSEDEKLLSFLDCEELSNFKEYSGEEIECEAHYYLAEYNNQRYIELHLHCADLTRAYVINEDCIDICENDPYDNNSECGKYLNGRELKEILLIEK